MPPSELGHRARVCDRSVSAARRSVARSRDRRALPRGGRVGRGDRRRRAGMRRFTACSRSGTARRSWPRARPRAWDCRAIRPTRPPRASNKLETRRRLAAAALPSRPTSRCPRAATSRAPRRTRASNFRASSSRSACRGAAASSAPIRGREFAAAFARISALLARVDVRAARTGLENIVLVERFIPGREFAVEGVLTGGTLQVFADLRQARPARWAVLRGDDLRDADGARCGEPSGSWSRPSSRRATRSGSATGRCTPSAAWVRMASSCSRWRRGRSAGCVRGCCGSRMDSVPRARAAAARDRRGRRRRRPARPRRRR